MKFENSIMYRFFWSATFFRLGFILLMVVTVPLTVRPSVLLILVLSPGRPPLPWAFCVLRGFAASPLSASKCSRLRRQTTPLVLAMWCTTLMASSSWPLYTRNLGLSRKRNTKQRRKKTASVMAPSVKRRYRQPMLLSRPQHGAPGARVGSLQLGSGLASEKLGEHDMVGMKPKAMALQRTTPIGWKMERVARRKRLFCGMNSSVMVVSIGMLPPTPKPTKAVRTRNVV